MRVLVTGVTGQIGSRVARILSGDPNLELRGLSRRPAEEAVGYVPVVGDMADWASVEAAVDGCDAIFLASSIHPDQVMWQTNVARAAQETGRNPTIVKLSGLGTDLDSVVDSGRWHAEIERAIEASGLPAVALRPHYFAQNLDASLREAQETGIFRGHVDGRVAMIDADDIAAVAATILVAEVDAGLRVLTLTGERAYSMSEIAPIMADVLERKVEFEATSVDASRAHFEALGMPPWHVAIMMQFRQAFSMGWGSQTTDDAGRVLGRSPRSLRESLQLMRDPSDP